MPGECITSTLPIDDGISVLWTLDPRCIRDKLLGLLEGGGGPTVEPLVEEDEEEEQGERPPMTGEAGPS